MAMSEFGKAFAAARKAGDKTFMFKGKKYTTETKEEKEARMPKKAAPESREEKADRMATTQRQKMAGSAAGAGRGKMAGRGAGDKMEDTRPFKAQVAEKSKPESKPADDKPRAQREPIRMEGLERAKRFVSGMVGNRERRLQMDEADRMSRGDKYGMGMKKGGSVKKSRDGMASKGKTKGRMC